MIVHKEHVLVIAATFSTNTYHTLADATTYALLYVHLHKKAMKKISFPDTCTMHAFIFTCIHFKPPEHFSSATDCMHRHTIAHMQICIDTHTCTTPSTNRVQGDACNIQNIITFTNLVTFQNWRRNLDHNKLMRLADYLS